MTYLRPNCNFEDRINLFTGEGVAGVSGEELVQFLYGNQPQWPNPGNSLIEQLFAKIEQSGSLSQDTNNDAENGGQVVVHEPTQLQQDHIYGAQHTGDTKDMGYFNLVKWILS